MPAPKQGLPVPASYKAEDKRTPMPSIAIPRPHDAIKMHKAILGFMGYLDRVKE